MYEAELEPNSKYISCTGNSTVEKLKNGSFLYKRYYTENKVITHHATYKSKKLEVLHGLYEERWDDGTLVSSGMYYENGKVGQWQENINERGSYKNGVKDGHWKTFRNDSSVEEERYYRNGKLYGTSTWYDSVGQVVRKLVFSDGEVIQTVEGDWDSVEETLPRFPGCEGLGLDDEELEECSTRNLLEFIYKNIRYPKKSRATKTHGKALAQFVIEKDGSLSEVEVLNGVSPDIEKEVIRIVNEMPKWIPGTQNGEPAETSYSLPIVFKLGGCDCPSMPMNQ
jgi:TonB family protein